jgi:hypothetical protein
MAARYRPACSDESREGRMMRAFVSTLTRFSAWLDDSWLGALLGAVIIGGFMVAIPVLLPIAFEVFHGR